MYLHGVIGSGLVSHLTAVKSLHCRLLESKRSGYWHSFVYDCIDTTWAALCTIFVLLLQSKKWAQLSGSGRTSLGLATQ